jgi:hypothetical protein
MLDKKTIQAMLFDSSTGCTIKFKKIDGTERTMWGTLNPELMPKMEPSNNDKPKKKVGIVESNDHVVLWDLEKGAWRSFRCDSLLSIFREKIESVFQKS